jgi:spore coat protein CotH
MKDGSIRSYNLMIAHDDLAFLNKKPKAEEYVPCNVTINYGTHAASTIHGARCRYKGHAGSWVGCTNSSTGEKLSPNSMCRKLNWKINLKHSQNAEIAFGAEKIQLLSMRGDNALTRNRLSYAILNDAGFVAPCATPSQIYVNAIYEGISDFVENIDHAFTMKREEFSLDSNRGRGAIFKEAWPTSEETEFYKEMVEKDSDDGHYYGYLLAGLSKEANRCKVARNCSKAQAAAILDKYMDSESVINWLVGLTLTANVDTPLDGPLSLHNFYFYVKDGRLVPIPWDYDETFAEKPGTGNAFWPNGIGGDFSHTQAWYSECGSTMVEIPGVGTFERPDRLLSCDPVGALMAVAWKERYLDRYRNVSTGTIAAAKEHIDRWEAQMQAGIQCDADNAGFPKVADHEAEIEKIIPLLSEIIEMNARGV